MKTQSEHQSLQWGRQMPQNPYTTLKMPLLQKQNCRYHIRWYRNTGHLLRIALHYLFQSQQSARCRSHSSGNSIQMVQHRIQRVQHGLQKVVDAIRCVGNSMQITRNAMRFMRNATQIRRNAMRITGNAMGLKQNAMRLSWNPMRFIRNGLQLSRYDLGLSCYGMGLSWNRMGLYQNTLRCIGNALQLRRNGRGMWLNGLQLQWNALRYMQNNPLLRLFPCTLRLSPLQKPRNAFWINQHMPGTCANHPGINQCSGFLRCRPRAPCPVLLHPS